jgi:hypothetical protein
MGKRLKSYVHVHDAEGVTHVYGPQDDVPSEHAELIGEHAWVDDDEPLPDNRPGVVVGNSGDDAVNMPRTGPAGGGKSSSPKASGGAKPSSRRSGSPAKSGSPEGAGEPGDSGSSGSDSSGS